MLRPGDVVTLSVRPPVRVTQYQFLKAGASITRTLGDKPLDDIREMRAALPRLYAEAVGQDLGIFMQLEEILADENAEVGDLKSWIVEHSDGSEEESVERHGKKVTRKKASARKRVGGKKASQKATGKKTRRRATKS